MQASPIPSSSPSRSLLVVCCLAQMAQKGGCSSKTMARAGGSLKLGSEQRDPVPCGPGIQGPGAAGARHPCLPADTGCVWSMPPLVGSHLCHRCLSHTLCWQQIPSRWAPTHHAWLMYQVPLTGITEAGELVFQGKAMETRGRGRSKVGGGGSLAPNPWSQGPGSTSSPFL